MKWYKKRKTYTARVRRRKKAKAPHFSRLAPMGRSLGMPNQNVVQLRYCTSVTLSDAIGGVLDLHAFSANSIYDPDVTGVGHQPMGRDQWEIFYNHYRVLSSRITIQAGQGSPAAGAPIMTGCYLADDVTVPSTWTTIAEAGRDACKMNIPANQDILKLKQNYIQSKFYKGQGANQSNLGAAMGASPSEQAYYIIYAQAADELSTFVSRTYSVTIDYKVCFSEPKDLVAS